ncbi:MAG: hypothetical protein QOE26_1358 [Verrucomicrobiota bacterium]|jgi:hypothetical protein
MKKLKTQRTLDKEVANRVEKNILIELYPSAVKQVVWYCQQFGRDPRDVVSGIVANAVRRLRERYDETTGGCSDATAGVLEGDVVSAQRQGCTDDRAVGETRRLLKTLPGGLTT